MYVVGNVPKYHLCLHRSYLAGLFLFAGVLKHEKNYYIKQHNGWNIFCTLGIKYMHVQV